MLSFQYLIENTGTISVPWPVLNRGIPLALSALAVTLDHTPRPLVLILMTFDLQSVGAALDETLGAGRVRRNVPVAPFTTFKIGGPADLFFEAESEDDLVQALLAARGLGIPYFLLGVGANILVGDK